MNRASWPHAAAAALLLLFLARLTAPIREQSATFDEAVHLHSGYAALTRRDYRFDRANPPAGRMWAALGLLPLRPNLPVATSAWATGDEWTTGQEFLYHNRVSAEALLARGRWMTALLSALVGLVVYLWGRAWLGAWPGVGALALYTADPNILAHGSVVTLDTAAMAGVMLTLWLLRRWFDRPVAWLALATGVAAGLALGTKFSALIIGPMSLVLFLAAWRQRPPGRVILRGVALAAAAGLVALAVIYRGHLDLYLKGLEIVRVETRGATHPLFIHGAWTAVAPWYTALLALVLKTPVPTLILAALGAARSVFRREDRRYLAWLLPAVVFCAGVSMSNMQMGLRYLLPILPLLHLLAARGLKALFVTRSSVGSGIAAPYSQVKATAGIALLVWLAVTSARAHPNYLTYYHEFAGGASRGHEWLVDSNYDWGQDLGRLAQQWRSAGNPDLSLVYYGMADGEHFGLRRRDLIPTVGMELPDGNDVPRSGPMWLAISASSLQGLDLSDHNLFAWARARRPLARAGYTIFVYDVGADAEALVKLGDIARNTDRPRTAIGYYERAIAARPGFADAWMGLGKARLIQRDQAGALAALRKALALGASDPRLAALIRKYGGPYFVRTPG